MDQKKLQTAYFFGLLLLALGLTGLVFLPYLLTIAMAITFTVIFRPVYHRILRLTLGLESLAAGLTVLFAVIIILVPLSFIGTRVVAESTRLYSALNTGSTSAFNVSALASEKLHQYFPHITIDIEMYVNQVLSWLSGNIGTIFSTTLQTFLHIVLGMLAFFYLLRDGEGFIASLISLSPLSDEYDRAILRRMESAINSSIKGSLLIATLQGISSGIGLTIFGLPNATLWGFSAAIGALVPGIGAPLVLSPAMIYLLMQGHIASAVGMLIWMLTAVGLIDNFIGPYVVGRGVHIHPIFVLFSVIGGISLLGPAGFIVGPLILSLLYAILDIYRTLFIEKKARSKHL